MPSTKNALRINLRLADGCRGFRGLLFATAAVWALSGRALSADLLRLITDLYPGDFGRISNSTAPKFATEVLREVFSAMGQDTSLEAFPTNRAWTMIVRGERDGILPTYRTIWRDRICTFPEEPLNQDRWVLFVRTHDVGKLQFFSFDDLVGHKVAVVEAVLPGWRDYPGLSPEMRRFLGEHHNMVETSGTAENFRMLAAGRVDYALAGLA